MCEGKKDQAELQKWAAGLLCSLVVRIVQCMVPEPELPVISDIGLVSTTASGSGLKELERCPMWSGDMVAVLTKFVKPILLW